MRVPGVSRGRRDLNAPPCGDARRLRGHVSDPPGTSRSEVRRTSGGIPRGCDQCPHCRVRLERRAVRAHRRDGRFDQPLRPWVGTVPVDNRTGHRSDQASARPPTIVIPTKPRTRPPSPQGLSAVPPRRDCSRQPPPTPRGRKAARDSASFPSPPRCTSGTSPPVRTR